MAYLAGVGIRGISLRDALNYRDSNGSWPEKSVVLTFDDGYENLHQGALPVLARHGFTATVYVVSSYMGGFNDWERPPTRLGKRRILTWEQAGELAAAGVEIGSHTYSHPDLRRLTSGEVEHQIRSSRDQIEKRLKTSVDTFAYPYGSLNRASANLVKREFRAACTTRLKRAQGDPLHRLPRVDMYYVRSLDHLRRLSMGELDRYLDVRRMGRAVRKVVSSGLQWA